MRVRADFGARILAQRNTVLRAATGLTVTGTADGVIEDNTFAGGSGDGVYLALAHNAPTSPSIVLRRNVVTDFAGRGIFSVGSSGPAIRYNDFSGNGAGAPVRYEGSDREFGTFRTRHPDGTITDHLPHATMAAPVAFPEPVSSR